MSLHVTKLQAIKNLTVKRPGNKATVIASMQCMNKEILQNRCSSQRATSCVEVMHAFKYTLMYNISLSECILESMHDVYT